MDKPAPVIYPIHPDIQARWSPRAFSDRPVPADVLRRLLEAARWAPSCFNEQPWRFLVASRDLDPEGHARLLGCINDSNARWAGGAPVLMVSVVSTQFSRNGRDNRWAAHDLGQAVGMMLTQATREGLVAHQMGGFDRDAVREACGVPEGCEPMAAVALGYPGDPASLPDELESREYGPRRRKGQDAFAFGVSFGEPLRTSGDAHRVLRFWFGELDDHGMPAEEVASRWWKKDESFDQEIASTFGVWHAAASRGELTSWVSGPRGRLALIVVLDQFSRNMYRDTPAMYANDAMAVHLALAGIEAGEDTELASAERVFLYMPLMHAESLELQDRCVALFTRLAEEAPAPVKDTLEYNLKFAVDHRDIVARFGRFPHRNAILGRESTEEEEAFLQETGSSF